MANNTKSNNKLATLANGTGKGIAEVSPAQLRAVAEQNLQSLLEAADTMTTLKAAEAGDVLMVVSSNHELSMQMVLRREGFRGRDQARTELDLQNMVTGDVFQHVIRGNQLPSDMLAALGVKVPRRASGKSPQVVSSTTRVVTATPVSVPVATTATPVATPVAQPESIPQVEQPMHALEEVASPEVGNQQKGVASSFASLILAGKDDSGSDEDPEAEEDEALCAVMAEDEERRFQNEDEEEETSDNEEEEEDFGSDEDFEEDEDSEDSDGE